jgi:hypothetical protein
MDNDAKTNEATPKRRMEIQPAEARPAVWILHDIESKRPASSYGRTDQLLPESVSIANKHGPFMCCVGYFRENETASKVRLSACLIIVWSTVQNTAVPVP